MGTGDGEVLGTTKVVDHGPDDKRWNLVILADGFTEDELVTFEQAVDNLVAALEVEPPLDELWDEINVHRVNVRSDDSGADDPEECDGSGAAPNTYFDGSFCTNGIQRLLRVDSGLALAVANEAVPETHAVIVIVNSTVYGGGGGSVATVSLDPDAIQIAIHELGHSAFGLADEYQYYVGCDEQDDENDNYGMFEPSEVNVTRESSLEKIKWAEFIDPDTQMPTMSNDDCSECDNRASTVPDGTVGAFEGAHYYHCGAFRPEYNCKMRNKEVQFCAICQQRIRDTFQCWRGRTDCIVIRDRGYLRCDAVAEVSTRECTEMRDDGYEECTSTRDEGYNRCTATRDDGYSSCRDWGIFSGLCIVWTWVSNIVCVSWTWVSNIVCVAWTWVSNIVCVAWTWITRLICVAWTWVTSVVCVTWRSLQC